MSHFSVTFVFHLMVTSKKAGRGGILAGRAGGAVYWAGTARPQVLAPFSAVLALTVGVHFRLFVSILVYAGPL